MCMSPRRHVLGLFVLRVWGCQWGHSGIEAVLHQPQKVRWTRGVQVQAWELVNQSSISQMFLDPRVRMDECPSGFEALIHDQG